MFRSIKMRLENREQGRIDRPDTKGQQVAHGYNPCYGRAMLQDSVLKLSLGIGVDVPR